MALFSNRPLSAALASLVATSMALGQSSDGQFRDEVSYTNDIRPIVNNFCTTCHAGNNPEGDFVLTSYQDVRKHVEEGDLLKRINDSEDPMPQNGVATEVHASHVPALGGRWFRQARESHVNEAEIRLRQVHSTKDRAR